MHPSVPGVGASVLLLHVLAALSALVVVISMLIATEKLWALIVALLVMPLALTHVAWLVGRMLRQET